MTIVPRSACLLIAAALAATSLAAEANVTTYSSRATFSSLGSISENYGFEDINTGSNGFLHQPNPFTTHGITYNTGGNNVVIDLGPGPTGKAFVSDAPIGTVGYISGSFANSYSMFGFDLGTFLGSYPVPVTVSLQTNLGSYNSLIGLVAQEAPGPAFLGFSVGPGEHFTSFSIAATTIDTTPVLDNVTLGVVTASPIPEPDILSMLTSGLALLGFGIRRRRSKSV